MWILLLYLPFLVPYFLETVGDPAPGLWTTRSESRRYECVERERDARARKDAPRGSYFNERTLHCESSVFGRDERNPQLEALLADLTAFAQRAAELATTEIQGVTGPWSVEVQHDDSALGRKASVALKAALAQRSRVVLESPPARSDEDIRAVGTLPFDSDLRVDCRLLTTRGALAHEGALLVAVARDPVVSEWHAGVCRNGVWQWLL